MRRPRWKPFASASGFAPSTLAELAWQRTRNAVTRWGVWGAVAGALFALVAFAPAAWLANTVASATDDRLLLTEARGTIWSGSALPVLTGGPGSRDASALPSRLSWDLSWRGLHFVLRARQPCCLAGELTVRVTPGFARTRVEILPPAGGVVGRWPASWLAGLGTPWNTLQLGGVMQLSSSGLTLDAVRGRWLLDGSVQLELANASSRLSTLPTLGSYRVTVQGNEAAGDTAAITLHTIEGALQMTGSGQWTGGRVRFRGEARAAEGSEAALNNLLNIIGRRQGARAIITIG